MNKIELMRKLKELEELTLVIAKDNGFQYIAKNKDGSTHIYKYKPGKDEFNGLWVYKGFFKFNNIQYLASNNEEFLKEIVEWSDSEPTEISMLINANRGIIDIKMTMNSEQLVGRINRKG